MQTEESLKKRAKAALQKEAAYGEKFDLDEYSIAPKETKYTDNLKELDEKSQRTLLNVGVIPSGEGRGGSLVMVDNAISHSSVSDREIELMPLHFAMQKHDWLKDYSWNLVPVDADKYTATSYLENANGYFIRAPEGVKTKLPIQTCLLMGSKDVSQTVHNIVIVEENARLDVITGCSTSSDVDKAMHLGISEMYVKKGGTLNFTMIHNWAEQIGVRPRTVIHLEEGATFINNYVTLKAVKSIQSYPTARLTGKGAFARFNTIAVAHPGSELDLGSRVIFDAPNTKAELVSRTITTGGTVIARGEMIGNAVQSKGHLECHGLVLNSKGTQRAIPILEANVDDIELTHEAAVGRIAREQVEYLMARGLSEEEAVGMIVRGFLDVGISGIPDELQKDIDETIAQIGKSAM
jgi:Fe-S cluster assembly scaffold protein SufB